MEANQFREIYLNTQEEIKKKESQMTALASKSIPLIVKIMKDLGKTELNVSDIDSSYKFCTSGFYNTGWDEGDYEPLRLFVYDDRLYLIGRDSDEYNNIEWAQSAINLSSSKFCPDENLQNLMGGLIPHMLDKEDKIYDLTDFEDGYKKADISDIEDEMKYFDHNDRHML